MEKLLYLLLGLCIISCHKKQQGTDQAHSNLNSSLPKSAQVEMPEATKTLPEGALKFIGSFQAYEMIGRSGKLKKLNIDSGDAITNTFKPSSTKEGFYLSYYRDPSINQEPSTVLYFYDAEHDCMSTRRNDDQSSWMEVRFENGTLIQEDKSFLPQKNRTVIHYKKFDHASTSR
ncbi:hypothetical protein [Siphonobacter sp. SORGH_AS_1065]|uniref:hypothetical protein n=1 Tax=Siphonobacter sp. SORGH_AS_1065 TaxID=3041795 RepID=UPI0027897425|nr:hypothetical protein [Siphonobacter sp. SORGH_AS_1065]MDQ1090465.1 hypothetical protein [Siphonobacter sp. SORGH_AS_1065]